MSPTRFGEPSGRRNRERRAQGKEKKSPEPSDAVAGNPPRGRSSATGKRATSRAGGAELRLRGESAEGPGLEVSERGSFRNANRPATGAKNLRGSRVAHIPARPGAPQRFSLAVGPGAGPPAGPQWQSRPGIDRSGDGLYTWRPGHPGERNKNMATYITQDCINCGACEPECPNDAISEGDEIYVIDPELCTECVGFHDHEACQAVCPVECCLPNPQIVEAENLLLQRAIKLHPDDGGLKAKAAANDFPSRFRK